MASKSVLVTGATGFIGANLARRLLSDGHSVHLIVRPERRSWRLEDVWREFATHTVDISDAPRVRDVVKFVRPEWVFHLAAYGAYPHQKDLQAMVRTNIEGLHGLVTACLEQGFVSFVNAGSSSEYGFKDHAPSEDESLDPNSPYALTKAYATMFCRYSALSSGGNIVTLRPYSVYGPYEEPTRLIPRMIVLGFKGGLPPLVSPHIARDFVHVDDLVEACLLAASQAGQSPGSVYNVGTGQQVTVEQVVAAAKKYLPIAEDPQWGSLEQRTWDTTTWVGDSRKIRTRLGWRPRYSFQEGFKKTVDWFNARRDMKDFYSDPRAPWRT